MSAAARQRKRREREARGVAVYPVEVDGKVLNGLEIAGLLREQEFGNKEAVANALGEALHHWAGEVFSSRVTLIARGRR